MRLSGRPAAAVAALAAALTACTSSAPHAAPAPAGGFPRQMALEPDGRVLLVTDFSSQQLETVNVTNLP